MPEYSWPDSEDVYWKNPHNWVSWPLPDFFVRLDFVPSLIDPVALNRSLDDDNHIVTDPNLWTTVIDDGTAAEAAWLVVGYYGWHVLNITGGTLHIAGNYPQVFYPQDTNQPYQIGYFMLEIARCDYETSGFFCNDSNSLVNISGGAVTGNGDFLVGGLNDQWHELGASGHLNMSGGTVDCNGTLQIGMYEGTGEFNLSGGVFTANSLQMTSHGLLTISGAGKLVLIGDRRTIVNGYIASGWIDSPAYVTYHAGSNTTEISASACGSGADLSGDCHIDYADIKIMANNWLAVGTNQADLSGDGQVNFKDFAMLAAQWLQVP
jgi:hypothetical protein